MISTFSFFARIWLGGVNLLHHGLEALLYQCTYSQCPWWEREGHHYVCHLSLLKTDGPSSLLPLQPGADFYHLKKGLLLL